MNIHLVVVCLALFVCVDPVICSRTSSRPQSSHTSHTSHTHHTYHTPHTPRISHTSHTVHNPHKPPSIHSTYTRPKPSAPISEPSHSRNYGWQVANAPSHTPTSSNIGWNVPHTTAKPYGWNMNPTKPAQVFYPAVSPIYANKPVTTIRYASVPAPTVSYRTTHRPYYSTTRRPWFTTTKRPWFTTTKRRWFTTTTTLPPPVRVGGVQGAVPPGTYPSYPGMMTAYPGSYAFQGNPGYSMAPPPGGYPYANPQFPPFMPPYSGYGSGYGAGSFGFGMQQKEKKSFFDSPAATVGTVFAGLALWELAKNRNDYKVYSGKTITDPDHHVKNRYSPMAANANLVPGEMYLVVPPGSVCTFSDLDSSRFKHVSMECKTASPFNATIILPANATETMPCNPIKKIESVVYLPNGDERVETSYTCRGNISIPKPSLRRVSYKKFTDTRVYSKVYGFCNSTVLQQILENSTSTSGGTIANASFANGVFVKNLTNETFSCHVPPPHLNPFQPLSAMTYFPKVGNPYYPFGYLFPPPYLPPGYSLCKTSTMDAVFKNSTNATTSAPTVQPTIPTANVTANVTATEEAILPCVPINPSMYPHVPASHPFYKTRYSFCNATTMALIHGRGGANESTNATNSTIATNSTNDGASVVPAFVSEHRVHQNDSESTPTMTYVTEGTVTASTRFDDGHRPSVDIDWKSMCVPLPPHMYPYPADVYPYLPAYGYPYPNIPFDTELFMVKLIPPPNAPPNITKHLPADKMKQSFKQLTKLDTKTLRVFAHSTYLGPLFDILQV